MKKVFILLIFFMFACSLDYQMPKNKNSEKISKNQLSGDQSILEQKPINPKCEDIPAVKIFQVFDDYALAYACDARYYYLYGDIGCQVGMVVYVPRYEGDILYNEKIIKPIEGMCISFDGIYTYETIDKFIRTIPKIKMINSQISKHKYQNWLDKQQTKFN